LVKTLGDTGSPFEFRSALGEKNINITLNDQELFAKLGKRKILGLFDFDDAFDHWKGIWKKKSKILTQSESHGIVKRHDTQNGWAMLLPVPAFRKEYASSALGGKSILSIEFLFSDRAFLPNMVGQKDLPLGLSQPYIFDSRKSEFARHVTDLGSDEFEGFQPLFETLHKIIEGRLS
jgi:hypothetical protein